MNKSKGNSNITTQQAVSRIQSSIAKGNGGQVPKGSYVGRMQAVVSNGAGKSVNKK